MRKEPVLNLTESVGMSHEELLSIMKAVLQVYPMIVLANLTKNTYSMVRNDGFLYNEVANSGCYEDLIDDNVENIHANYQSLFQGCFSREHLLQIFSEGKTEVYAELYQKDKEGKYHWVSAHVIKVDDGSGDIVHVCLNRVLDGIVEERLGIHR